VIGPGGGRAADIWVADLVHGSLSRLTFDNLSSSPVWTRDSRRVAYVCEARSSIRFAWRLADGSDESQELVAFDDLQGRQPVAFTSDGTGLVFVTQGTGGTSQDIYCWSSRDDSVTEIARTSAGEECPALSPDGAWMAYDSDESGSREVYVQDFPARRGRWQVADGATVPCWSRDGRELYLIKGRSLLAVPVDTSSSFSTGAVRTIAQLDFIPSDESEANYDVAPDGRLLVVRSTSKESYQHHVNVVLHWPAELRTKDAGAPDR